MHDTTWKGSSRGHAVDICAPAQHVYRASRKVDDPNPAAFGAGEGTSFAVALTAGVAALWLAHHGRQRLIDSLSSGERLQDRFARLLKQTARLPPGWETNNFGAGIVDARRLLGAGIGDSGGGLEALSADHTAWGRGTPLDADQTGVARDVLTELAGGIEAPMEDVLLQRHGLELIWLAFERQRRQKALEVSIGSLASNALRQALGKPENAGVARILGLH